MCGPEYTKNGCIACRDYCDEPLLYCFGICLDPEVHAAAVRRLNDLRSAEKFNGTPTIYGLLDNLREYKIISLEELAVLKDVLPEEHFNEAITQFVEALCKQIEEHFPSTNHPSTEVANRAACVA